MKKRAILSVWDKTGIVDFAKDLEALGYEIISTGGTARELKAAGLDVIDVPDITGFPECLDGRVKTLHPMVHAGILAMRSNPEHMQQLEKLHVTPIDIVAINLYPFKATILKPNVKLEDAIENIDIGGPTMLRAAAKNWQDVAVVVDTADYATVIAQLKESGSVSRETKFALSGKVFEHTAAYDALIANYLRAQRGESPLGETFTQTYEKVQDMRYGENPHQAAAFYKESGVVYGNTLADAKQLHGKELSYNNINDTNGALDVLKEFGEEEPVAVGVKHANPCGVGTGATIYDAYLKAYNADPVSIFGGIVALNREVDAQTAAELAKIFLEIIVAPSFSKEALEILTAKKNLRLLELPNCAKANSKKMLDMKKVAGGLLVQELDTQLGMDDLKVVTDRAPTEDELKQLKFAWRIVKHTKSNGICLVKDNATTGVGPGQTNRITALELAIKYAGENAKGSVMGSDAFFPFDDCVKAAKEAGITAIIQPGGSIRDEDSIKACNEAGIAMVFTGMRHFKH
ncbi:MAG: bifunctional phosphoribosylaminoimidazolecarboxamide formyltransferase/IMP cyclohydrolase [Oscillospiraceae bacterium]|nr:bifunctional phosphoribosylaminoimidazolecarboxamide formyltransferase/IMP cyclohydrolase [Oscillospiraceae bacterium]